MLWDFGRVPHKGEGSSSLLSPVFPFFPSAMRMGWRMLLAVIWDQEVTLRMEAIRQDSEAERQKGPGAWVPRD